MRAAQVVVAERADANVDAAVAPGLRRVLPFSRYWLMAAAYASGPAQAPPARQPATGCSAVNSRSYAAVMPAHLGQRLGAPFVAFSVSRSSIRRVTNSVCLAGS